MSSRIAEWSLFATTVLVTLVVALLVLRWLAPGLLGLPVDLQIVQVDERVVPFFDNVFRGEDRSSDEFILKDPRTVVRGHPFYARADKVGPTDLLGFRNHSVPRQADVITIGDSQTAGVGVPINASWPQQLQGLLGNTATVYNMSVGGWGAVQYLDMWSKAQVFKPGTVIIAFYPGNDPRESFRDAYSIEHWAFLRPDAELGMDDMLPVHYPIPRDELWGVSFSDGSTTVLTPQLRLASNLDHPTIATGWEIMAQVAEQVAKEASELGIEPIFIIIPTKERAYARRIEHERAGDNREYLQLVTAEQRYSAKLAERIEDAGAIYVDVFTPISQAVFNGRVQVYPHSFDGHLRRTGHTIIARAVLHIVRTALE